MKIYIKPKLEYVQLTAEEKIASTGSCITIYFGDSGACPTYWDSLVV